MGKPASNHGIGAIYATFRTMVAPLQSCNAGEAVTCCGNAEISGGYDGAVLLGRLEHLHEDDEAVVQVMGIARFCHQGRGDAMPRIGHKVVLDGKGGVREPRQAEMDRARGLVISCSNNLCEVLL